MRNMSFALTTEQVRNQTKTVTRRLGWLTLKPGAMLQPVVKGMGLKKGQSPEKIGKPIRVVSVRREKLGNISPADVDREGFGMTSTSFVLMFCEHNGCEPNDDVTRIEFEYLQEGT